VSPVRYELGFYIPEDGILHSHRRENLKSYRRTKAVTVAITRRTRGDPWHGGNVENDAKWNQRPGRGNGGWGKE
jgi:hypothetical protein